MNFLGKCLALAIITLLIFPLGAEESPKRGSAYGFHSVNDLTKLLEGLSW